TPPDQLMIVQQEDPDASRPIAHMHHTATSVPVHTFWQCRFHGCGPVTWHLHGHGTYVTPRRPAPGQSLYSLTAAAIPPQVRSRCRGVGDMVTARTAKGSAGGKASKKAQPSAIPDLVQLLTPEGEL